VSPLAPVTPARIATASKHLENAAAAAKASRTTGLPFYVACALLEQEGGRNIYGHDEGGVNTVKGNLGVTPENFMAFLFKVLNGATSNGVGPCQITYAGKREPVSGGGWHRDGGHFAVMAERGLLPWVPEDNMEYGFSLLAAEHRAGETWEKTYARYNGGSDPGRRGPRARAPVRRTRHQVEEAPRHLNHHRMSVRCCTLLVAGERPGTH
jgi:hypothetical protein